MSNRVGRAATASKFPDAARAAIANSQLRHNVRRATDTIRAKRARVVGEMPDWQALRDSGNCPIVTASYPASVRRRADRV